MVSTPSALLNCFISGLRTEIQREMAVMQPQSLPKAIGLAKLLEAKLQEGRTSNPRYPKSPATVSSGSVLGQPPPTSTTPIRRLTPAEQAERRAKGLCFNCDEKFSHGHKCKSRQFLLLLSEDDTPPSSALAILEPSLMEPDPQEHGASEQDASLPLCEHFQLSRATLVGPPCPQTLRICGHVRELEVTILIDSGSSHNIMQPRVQEFLQLPLVAITPFSMLVGNGESIPCAGQCPDVPVKLVDTTFHIPFYILPIHGADLVLGVQWLQTLVAFLSDYNVPSIQFTLNGQPFTLTGTKHNTPTHATFGQFCRFTFTDSIASMHTISVTTVEQPSSDTLTSEPPTLDTSHLEPTLSALLQKYATIFQKPQGLPPNRAQDHHIHLHPDSTPVNVKPYRYPHYQKEVITNMIQEMLTEGIIKPSTSPFSSLVLLVRKKDGSWRFCVDYRALNTITVKDRFPIPTVDELLDELHGSRVFSKLDLRSGYHQILLNPADTFKTAFRTVDGHFEFLVMPFGLTNAPTTFQATMNEVFRDYLRKFVLVFFDGILIYSMDWVSHLQHLEQVLQLLHHHKLFAKFSKCYFGVDSVEYLDHIVS